MDYTSHCKDGYPRRAAIFVREMHERILVDAARGRGESMASLATLLEVPAKQRGRFRAKMKRAVPDLVARHPQGIFRYVASLAATLRSTEG